MYDSVVYVTKVYQKTDVAKKIYYVNNVKGILMCILSLIFASLEIDLIQDSVNVAFQKWMMGSVNNILWSN